MRVALGGSSSSVYSRTSLPPLKFMSRITSTDGSCTARVLVIRITDRPSGPRTSKLRGRQRRVVFDARGTAGLGRRHAQQQRRCLFGRQVGDVDLGAQRLAERRDARSAAQPERARIQAPQACGGNGEPAQREPPGIESAVFQGVSPFRAAEPGPQASRSAAAGPI
ncbi:MAG: hypothetical protein U1E95_06635 [Rubrivivax sp.]